MVTGIKGSFAHQDVVPLQSSPRLVETIWPAPPRRRCGFTSGRVCVCVCYYNDKTRANAVQVRTPERVDAQVSSRP